MADSGMTSDHGNLERCVQKKGAKAPAFLHSEKVRSKRSSSQSAFFIHTCSSCMRMIDATNTICMGFIDGTLLACSMKA